MEQVIEPSLCSQNEFGAQFSQCLLFDVVSVLSSTEWHCCDEVLVFREDEFMLTE